MKIEKLIDELKRIQFEYPNIDVIAAVGGDQRHPMTFVVVDACLTDDYKQVIVSLEDDE